MCGIIGYVGKNDFIKVAKQGLLNLEYRGYDSAGLSFFEKDKITTIKNVGDVKSLFSIVPHGTLTSVGIGHTRWATHGVPTVQNCHPHYSEDKKFYVVHNGIIENYQQIKDTYLKKTNFYSETDTEVIPNLLSHFYSKNHNVVDSIKQTIDILKGSFALVIMHSDEPSKLYFAKRNSPLIIGIGKGENYISSDLLGFGDSVKKYIITKDNSYGFITTNKIKLFVDNLCIKPEIKKLTKSKFNMSLGDYPFYMLKEISEVPLAIQETCAIYEKKHNPLTNINLDYFKGIDEILFVACGTSYHSGLVGAKYCKLLANIKSRSVIASEFIYEKEILNQRTLCVFISQSGETADTLSAIKKAKQNGAKTIGITNVQNSTICQLCDYILPIKAGREVAVASTKAYNAQLTMLLILAGYIGNHYNINKTLMEQLKKASNIVDPTKIINNITKIVKKLSKSKNIYLVGRDLDYITCMEASLKLKEISYIPCEAYPAGELKHGTLALITKNTPVIAVITQKSLIDKTMMIINQVKARGGKVYVFTNQDLSKYDTKGLTIVKTDTVSCELVSPIITIVVFQLLAYQTTLCLGYNPDRPRNLAKSVTVE